MYGTNLNEGQQSGHTGMQEGMRVDEQRAQAHFRANGRLVFWLLVIWALVSYGGIIFVRQLNQVSILTGFPLGYYMGAQGSLVVFVALIFYYARAMDRIDREFGVEE